MMINVIREKGKLGGLTYRFNLAVREGRIGDAKSINDARYELVSDYHTRLFLAMEESGNNPITSRALGNTILLMQHYQDVGEEISSGNFSDWGRR